MNNHYAERPLRIAHLSATFPPYYGGTGVVCLENARRLVERGHEVTVFTSASANAPTGVSEISGVQVVRLPAILKFGNAPLIPSLFKTRPNFDLLHLHYPFYWGGEAVWWQHCLGVPYIVTYHQDVLLKGASNFVVQAHHATAGRAILGGARRILATSMDYAENSRLAALPGRVRDRIHELPNGVDDSHFRPQNAFQARRRLGLGNGPLVLFVGALDTAHYFKGVSILLSAFKRLSESRIGAGARLVIVGDGDRKANYMAQSEALGLGARVHWAGRVSDADLPDYYAAADVVVLPSISRGEAFGVVLLEAMASGRPVIASALPGVRSVVDNGKDGLLTPPGDPAALADAIEALISNSNRSAAMGAAGRAKVERRYRWSYLVSALEDHYTETLTDIEAAVYARAKGAGA